MAVSVSVSQTMTFSRLLLNVTLLRIFLLLRRAQVKIFKFRRLSLCKWKSRGYDPIQGQSVAKSGRNGSR